MKDRTVTLKGNRTVVERSKGPDGKWTTSTIVQTGITTSTETFATTNGTGGDPGRFLATPYSFYKRRSTNGHGYVFKNGPNYEYSQTGAIAGSQASPSISYTDPSDMSSESYNRALDSLALKWRGQLDLSVDGLEFRKTAKMVRSALKLVHYVKSFHPRHWSSRWLEYQYGWRPTVSTIYELAREAVTPPSEGLVYYSSRATSTGQRSFRTANNGFIDTVTCSRSNRTEIKLALKLQPSTVTQLARISSLNPASIAWELLPGSFIVDWVFDIGSYLRATESAYVGDLFFSHGYRTDGELIRREFIASGSSRSGNITTSRFGSRFEIETYKRRTRLTAYPRPLRPSVKIEMGSARVLSAAALLREWFKR